MGRDISTGGLINNWDGALNPYYVMYQYKIMIKCTEG